MMTRDEYVGYTSLNHIIRLANARNFNVSAYITVYIKSLTKLIELSIRSSHKANWLLEFIFTIIQRIEGGRIKLATKSKRHFQIYFELNIAEVGSSKPTHVASIVSDTGCLSQWYLMYWCWYASDGVNPYGKGCSTIFRKQVQIYNFGTDLNCWLSCPYYLYIWISLIVNIPMMGIDNFVTKIKLVLNNSKYMKQFFKIVCGVVQKQYDIN